jgi:hypothetical protein
VLMRFSSVDFSEAEVVCGVWCRAGAEQVQVRGAEVQQRWFSRGGSAEVVQQRWFSRGGSKVVQQWFRRGSAAIQQRRFSRGGGAEVVERFKEGSAEVVQRCRGAEVPWCRGAEVHTRYIGIEV